MSLFEAAGEEDRHLPELVREPIWSEKKRLQEEKNALGLCLTGHMFDAYRDETSHFIRQPLSKVTEGKDQLIAGIITSARMLTGQRGRMMIATIDDGSAALEVTLYSEVYEPNRSWLKEDELLVAKVNVTPDKFSGGTTSGGACLMQFPEELRIYPDDACLHGLNQILASKQKDPVQIQYH